VDGSLGAAVTNGRAHEPDKDQQRSTPAFGRARQRAALRGEAGVRPRARTRAAKPAFGRARGLARRSRRSAALETMHLAESTSGCRLGI